jgi:hypothetical protein
MTKYIGGSGRSEDVPRVVGRGSWVVGRGTWDVGRGTWDVGRGTWDVGRGTWENSTPALFSDPLPPPPPPTKTGHS